MAGIWAEVLRLPRVGLRQNFFELGGHSLLATQVLSRAREAFQLDLPLRLIFEEPTVGGMALAIVQKQAAETDADELARLLDELEGPGSSGEAAPLS